MTIKETITWALYIIGLLAITGFGIGILLYEKKILYGVTLILGGIVVFGTPMYKELRKKPA